MIVVDFRDFGPVPPHAIEASDLRRVLEASEELLCDHDTEAVAELLADWTAALMWQAISEEVMSEEWYQRALAVICLRGLRGELQPKFLNFTSKD